ncbi:hypothetical protein Pint_06917 [Pistacia integerrima]|uniref:Uncharacterized protein n=1 Tax=Pistacia integerrima TaxID=434235 RepID=A0ACC0XYG4_9ROSI|nr:hypothetical protein Pint_06917 [Pistacia integerrima]
MIHSTLEISLSMLDQRVQKSPILHLLILWRSSREVLFLNLFRRRLVG